MLTYLRPLTDWNRVVHNQILPEPTLPEGTDHQIGSKQMGAGPINWAINHLPFEMHLYDKERKLYYNWAGPGTKVQKRLARGDIGINKLDEAAKDHDLWYYKYKTSEECRPADAKLAKIAQQIANDPTATKDEREKANLVASVMHGMSYLGAGRVQVGGAAATQTSTLEALMSAAGSLFEYANKRKTEMKAEEQKKKAAAIVAIAPVVPVYQGFTPSKWNLVPGA